MQFETQIDSKNTGERLDQFLSNQTGVTRSAVQKQILHGRVKVNGHPAKKSGLKLRLGDQIEMPLNGVPRPKLKPSALKLEILYEDAKMLVINKPAGIVVHPDTTGHQDNTIANAVIKYLKVPEKSHDGEAPAFDELRPGIVHRLDKDTSGVLVIAKTPESLHQLSRLFQNRKVQKTYLALVKGCPKTDKGRISAPIKRDSKNRQQMAIHGQGKHAVTHFEVLETYGWCSLLEVGIETGRTHQIRLHLASIGHPILGDSTYGDKNTNLRAQTELGLNRHWLHAKELVINGDRFVAPLAKDLEETRMKL